MHRDQLRRRAPRASHRSDKDAIVVFVGLLNVVLGVRILNVVSVPKIATVGRFFSGVHLYYLMELAIAPIRSIAVISRQNSNSAQPAQYMSRRWRPF